MGLFEGVTIERALPPVSYPTASQLDIQIGTYKTGYDGKWYCTGGLTRGITGVIGWPNTYKSTAMASLIMRSMCIHSGSSTLIHDTEDSLSRDMDRIYRLSGEFNGTQLITEDNLFFLDSSNTISDTEQVIDSLCAAKDKNKKDLIVESPFIDKNGDRIKVWIPTYISIDTYSSLVSNDELELMHEGLDSSKINTIYMKGGGKKSVFLSKLNMLANKYGLCVVLTAHMGKMSTMGQANPNVPPPKQLQYMKQGEQIKNVGSQFDRLTNPLIQTTSAKKLVASDGKCEYNYKGTTAVEDLNEIAFKVLRNKNGTGSGNTTPYVISQNDGLLNTLTNYHYLRSNKYYGLNGNMQRHQVALLPDVTITRNTIRELSTTNKQLCRALEIVAQYLYIQLNYNTAALPFDLSISPSEIFEKLNTKSNELLQRVLNSRGYWVASTVDDGQEYFSIFDILSLIK